MLHRHATDVVSLVSGILFAGLTAIWLLNAADVVDLQTAWLAGPLILILAGVVGLVVALRPSGRGTVSASARPPVPAASASSDAREEPTAPFFAQADHDDEPTTALPTQADHDNEPTTTLPTPADRDDERG